MAGSVDLRFFDSSVYILKSQTVVLGNRNVSRYILEDSSAEKVNSAYTVIQDFLDGNPSCIPIFDTTSPDSIKTTIRECPYLTINHRVICLSKTSEAPDDIDIKCKNIFFSGALIDEPVQCPQGHPFEKRHIEYWVSAEGDRCPDETKGVHQVGPIAEDFILKEHIKGQVRQHESNMDLRRQCTEQKEALDHHRMVQSIETLALKEAIRPGRTPELMGGTAKIVVKGAFVAQKLVIHTTKKIPFASLVFGVILAIMRGFRSQPEKAILELASGLAACFPGPGTTASLALDFGMAGHDVYETQYQDGGSTNALLNLKLTPEGAREILHLNDVIGTGQKPTKEQITKAYHTQTRRAHPDKLIKVGSFTQAEFDAFQAKLGEAKDILYREHNYS